MTTLDLRKAEAMAEDKTGRLYLAATPIGNLEDMTYRGVRLLQEADLIAAEDTRHTRKLLAHYDIHTAITSYHEHNKITKGPELVEKMLAGTVLVCVSDAGLPGISDPGADLAKLAVEAGIEVSPLPGANAALSALICSGLDTTTFTFFGFLPPSRKKRRELLAALPGRQETMIFYEAPHHLRDTLEQLVGVLGVERQAAAARELTKKYESFQRSTLGELLTYYEANEPRGEFVLIVAGATPEEAEQQRAQSGNAVASADPVQLVHQLEAGGLPRKEAMREAAKQLGISRREVYNLLLQNENEG